MLSSVSKGTNVTLYTDDTKIWREINHSCDKGAFTNDVITLGGGGLEKMTQDDGGRGVLGKR